MKNKSQNILILNDIRSVENVGAMFRTADAAGVSLIYLVGYTPAPVDRFGRKRMDLHKSALGAEDYLKWQSVKNIVPLLTRLKKDGYQIIAVEQAPNSVDYKKVKPTTKNVFIVGNEVTGLDQKTLKRCDVVAEIPMRGKKESLNVSVACGIALFGIIQ